MPDTTITKAVNAAWKAGEAFKDIAPPSKYMAYLLTIFFIKYISDLPKGLEDTELPEDGVHELAGKVLTRAGGRFLLPSDCTFQALYELRHTPGNAARIDAALANLSRHNVKTLEGVFEAIQFSALPSDNESLRDEALRSLLEVFWKPGLKLAPLLREQPDYVGKIFELLLHRFATVADRTEEAFHTPPALVDLMARLASPEAGETIYDPACGSGSALIQCGKYIRERKNSKDYALYGQERSETMLALAKMNLLIHGEDCHRLEHGDVIQNPKHLVDQNTLQQFDVVISNPPYSIEHWPYELAQKDPFERFKFGIPPKTRGNYALILHMIASMKPQSGRTAVIVPQGVLFRGASEADIRQKLIQGNLVDAVIGLPEKLLYNTPIPVSVLILRMDKVDTNVLFIDASEDCVYGRTQNTLAPEHIGSIVETYKKRLSVPSLSSLVGKEKILANESNLSIALYVDRPQKNAIRDVAAVNKEREHIKKTLRELDRQISETLRSMGHDI